MPGGPAADRLAGTRCGLRTFGGRVGVSTDAGVCVPVHMDFDIGPAPSEPLRKVSPMNLVP